MDSPKRFVCPACKKPFCLETHGLESCTLQCPTCKTLLLLQAGDIVVEFHKFMATQVEGWPTDGVGIDHLEITYPAGEC
jgi:hypothetical protein